MNFIAVISSDRYKRKCKGHNPDPYIWCLQLKKKREKIRILASGIGKMLAAF